jgi:hydroxymethylpyrimidine pyrophosphatase-like HAD family hydrolase
VGLRLVATDLDGTLLHSDGTVTDRTRQVLDELDTRGVTVVFVTGRPIRWMEPLWHHVGDHGLAICSNGGIVYDVPGRSVVEARTIPRDVGLEVASVIREALPGTMFGLEQSTGFAKEPAFLPRSEDASRPELRIGPLEEVFDDSVVKMLALHEELDPEEYWASVEKLVGASVTTTWSAVGALVEMSAAGVDQGVHPGAGLRGARDHRRGGRRLRGHAQRHRDAPVGRHVVRHGQRAPLDHRLRPTHRPAPRRGRRRAGARGALPQLRLRHPVPTCWRSAEPRRDRTG